MLNGVITVNEAVRKWNLNKSTIIRLLKNNLVRDVDYCKSGGTILILNDSLNSLLGCSLIDVGLLDSSLDDTLEGFSSILIEKDYINEGYIPFQYITFINANEGFSIDDSYIVKPNTILSTGELNYIKENYTHFTYEWCDFLDYLSDEERKEIIIGENINGEDIKYLPFKYFFNLGDVHFIKYIDINSAPNGYNFNFEDNQDFIPIKINENLGHITFEVATKKSKEEIYKFTYQEIKKDEVAAEHADISYIDSSDYDMYIVRQGGKIVGYLSSKNINKKELFLDNIYIGINDRKKGFGKLLIKEYLKINKNKIVRSLVSEEHELQLFLKSGFKIENSPEPNYYNLIRK